MIELHLPAEFKAHVRGAHKEMLLAMRSIVDAAIEHVEKKPPGKETIEEIEIPDDLTAIRGIGATAQARLNQAGINTYTQLVTLTPERVAKITGRSASRINKEQWIQQAQALAEGTKE